MTPDDWRRFEHDILERTNIRAELASHIEFYGEPNDDGWCACKAVGRDDTTPSAAVNIASTNGALGRYVDKGGDNATCSFWDLTVKLGMFPDWLTARKHYAEKAGVSLPQKGKLGLLEQVDFTVSAALHDDMIGHWCKSKPPITVEAAKAAGVQVCRWPLNSKSQFRCLAFSAYRSGKLSGLLLYCVDGTFPAMGSLAERKTHNVKGSKDGWVIVGGQQAFDAATTIIKTEGVPDALALYPHLPPGHVAITNIGGAGGAKGCPCNIFAGKRLIVIGDCDTPGAKGAYEFAVKAAPQANETRLVTLPFEMTPDHGKDLRDFFAEGGTFEKLMEGAGEPIRKTAAHTDPTKNFTEGNSGGSIDGGEGDVDIGGWCDHSDLGNSRLFVKMHGDKVRYCHPWGKWIVWDGTRWAVDESGAVERLAKDVADHRWREALELVREEDAMKFAVKSASAERIAAMLKLARSEPGMPIMPGDLDRDPWLLNCKNGTLDLRTGKLRPHQQEDLLTKLCPAAFNPDAESYWWDRFLEAIFGGRQSLIDFCRRYFGYSVTGSVREQILLILWGTGSNGKSTLLNALMDTLGSDYTLKAVADLLLVKKNESHPTERADLFGKRFVVCVETADGRGLNEALVKEMTGGDRIRARRLYEDFWEFIPTHKPALCTNHKPRVRGSDHAIWRRMALLPFGVQFWNPDKNETGPEETRQDKSLPEKLAKESEGILAWLVRGCLEWQRDGLKMPPEVMLATSEYQQEQDSFGAFITENCVVADACRVRAGELYSCYREWSDEIGEHPVGQRRFGEAMTEKGFERFNSSGWWYRGVGIKSNV